MSLVSFPAPPDQPADDVNNRSKENELMRPIGGIFLVLAVAVVFLLLAGLEIWRRWGISMAAYREVLNMQRQRDLMEARKQMCEYKRMIQDYKEQLQEGEGHKTPHDASGELDSFLMQQVVAAVGGGDELQPPESSAPPSAEPYTLDSDVISDRLHRDTNEDGEKKEEREEIEGADTEQSERRC